MLLDVAAGSWYHYASVLGFFSSLRGAGSQTVQTRDQLRWLVISLISVAGVLAGGECCSADVEPEPAAGVRITPEDHQRIVQTIHDTTGIEISDWVWEQYWEASARVQAAFDATRDWLGSRPRETIHGQRPKGAPPDTIRERSEILAKSASRQFNIALLELEEGYFDGLAIHQVSTDLVAALRNGLYRRNLLPKNQRFAGANVDVLAVLSDLRVDVTYSDDTRDALNEITQSYASDIMGLLLDQAAAEAAVRHASPTLFEAIYAPESDEPQPKRVQRKTRPAAIEGQIAVRNAQCIDELVQVLPEHVSMRLVSAWRTAVYPFLWRADLEATLARLAQSSSEDDKAMCAEIRQYQRSMHDALWDAQCRAADHETMIRDSLGMTPDGAWRRYADLHQQCIEDVKQYVDSINRAARGEVPR